jgi:type I restriction enzyme S subunit
LGDLCFKITDGFHNTPPKIKEGFPYIAATQVKTNSIDWENCHFVAEKYHRELYNKAYPKRGELLVVNIGAGCGTPAIIDVDFEFSFKNTAILKFNQNLISNKLLNYYFIWKREEIYAELTKGGLQPFLSLTILNSIKIALPPLPEQKAIVEKLDKLMAYCDQLEESIKNSQKQNEMLLQQVLREALEPKTETLKEEIKL